MTNLLSISRLTPTIFIKCLWVLLLNKLSQKLAGFFFLYFKHNFWQNQINTGVEIVSKRKSNVELCFVTFTIVSQCTSDILFFLQFKTIFLIHFIFITWKKSSDFLIYLTNSMARQQMTRKWQKFISFIILEIKKKI